MEKEVITSDERLIMVKEIENEFLCKLYSTIHSVRAEMLETTLTQTEALLKMPTYDRNFEIGRETTLLYIKCMKADARLQDILEIIKDVKDCLESCAAPVDYLKLINKNNRNLVNCFQQRGLDEAVKYTQKFMNENRELFSVTQLKAQLELEEKEEIEKVYAIVNKNNKPEEVVCKSYEVVKPITQQQILADKINAKYNDLCDIKRDLPITYDTKESVAKFDTRLNKIAKDYRLPMDASRSLGCYRQAEGDIEKVYDELENIKNISSQNYISGNIIYQQ